MTTYVSFHLYDPSNLQNPLLHTHTQNNSNQPAKKKHIKRDDIVLK